MASVNKLMISGSWFRGSTRLRNVSSFLFHIDDIPKSKCDAEISLFADDASVLLSDESLGTSNETVENVSNLSTNCLNATN